MTHELLQILRQNMEQTGNWASHLSYTYTYFTMKSKSRVNSSLSSKLFKVEDSSFISFYSNLQVYKCGLQNF